MKGWQLSALILAMSASGALADEAENEADEDGATERVCVKNRNINSFDAIDEQHIYVKATGNNHFLFTMQHRCLGLGSAFNIGLKNTMSQVCSDGFGRIEYQDSMGRFESCRIDTIERVTGPDDAKRLVIERHEAKREENTDD